ncbi:MAG: sulfate adenylyltransferase [Chloroflexi bacterium]|nr:sulfate adenylyltransferase [Chloroflexota bacterium]
MPTADSIAPHGGELVNRWVVGEEALALAERALTIPSIRLKARQAIDLEMIAVGAYSPLVGFMERADYLGVLEELRLDSGLPWPLPITLAVSTDEAAAASEGKTVALVDERGIALGLLDVTERYRFNKESEALATLGTVDAAHPAVAEIFAAGDTILAGPVKLFRRPRYDSFAHYRFDPAETRRLFITKHWHKVACARLHHPMSRGDEYLQKCTLETVDGLLLHAPAPATQDGSLSSYTHIAAAERIAGQYLPGDQAMIAVLPHNSRGAGARELLLEAIISQNYGCSHFLVPEERVAAAEAMLSGSRRGALAHHQPGYAKTLFARFGRDDMAIDSLFLSSAFYCRDCGTMATKKTCPHAAQRHVTCPSFDWQDLERRHTLASPDCFRPEVTQLLNTSAAKCRQRADGQQRPEHPDSPSFLAARRGSQARSRS